MENKEDIYCGVCCESVILKKDGQCPSCGNDYSFLSNWENKKRINK